MRSEHVGMFYRNPVCGLETIRFNVGKDGEVYSEQKIQAHSVHHTRCGNVYTVIPSDGTIAGYLPAPKQAELARDYTIMGTASDGTRVVIAECHHEDITPEPEPAPDLAASLFGASVVVADPEPEPEPEETPQTVMFTYKSGKVKHELRAGSTIVKVGKSYYNLNGRKITAIYTDDTCKRIVPERYYSRLFNVSEDPTLFA